MEKKKIEMEKEQEQEMIVPRDQPYAERAYPAVRRVSRLSFAILAVMGETSQDEGRQAWLETNGVVARLRAAIDMLRSHRKVR